MSNQSLQEVERLGEAEVSKWTDDRFGSVDVVGIKSGRDYAMKSVGGDAEADPRFAPIDSRATSFRQKLENAMRDPDFAKETGNEQAIFDALDKEAEREVIAFRDRCPGYFRSEENWQTMVRAMAQKYLRWPDVDEVDADECYRELLRGGFFTEANLTATFKALYRDGLLEVSADAPRQLTAQEQRSVMLLAATQPEAALIKYLQYRLPEDVVDDLDLDDIADPRFSDVVGEAVWFVWENSRPGYTPTAERRRFMKRYIAGRVPTLPLIDAAWRQCQIEERDVTRQNLLGQLNREATPTPPDIDDLSDSEVKQLYEATAKHIAKNRPRAAGVIV